LGCALQTVKTWRHRFVTDRLRALEDRPRSGRPAEFPARTVATLKAIACELPAERGLPLSRFSLSEIQRELRRERLQPLPSRTTVWRILHRDGIRPWFYRTWIHKRAPDFLEKATPILDLYEGFWEGRPLGPNDQVICSDEKTGIQLLHRKIPTRAPRPGTPGKVEFEYTRHGTLCFQGALDVRHGRVFGAFPLRNTAEAFRSFVTEVMDREPYASASRVFWVTDNGSAHHPKSFGPWLIEAFPRARAVHTPVHASWIDQEELFLAILTKKALTPRDFASREEAKERIRGFLARWNRRPRPFRWRYTRQDLRRDLKRWSEEEPKRPVLSKGRAGS
jgi:transposase